MKVHSVLVLLWWWSGQQLARLTESSNVRSSPLREDEVPAVHSFPSLPPSLPPRCRFYELPWALIHLCHTQAPLLGLLTNWLGCRWEGPAGHIWFLQPGQRPASRTTKICGHLGVDKHFSMFVKIQVNRVWECSCTSCCDGCVAAWVGWSLRKHLNWFGHWELKAVDLNMKDMIIQRPSGLLVSSDWINNVIWKHTHGEVWKEGKERGQSLGVS